ncbi:MAG: hypothetical protein G01um101438_779 [Parcubacteria group bacterium Gr01-1014_38]|nr:MAG: hypothetical protein G01um101438_779 [Parcubacteria group bacterium Gr01-1014_38]
MVCLTKHAKRRMRQRALSRTRLWRALRGKKQYRGKGIYHAETKSPAGTTVVVYKRRGAKKVILSAWKKRS